MSYISVSFHRSEWVSNVFIYLFISVTVVKILIWPGATEEPEVIPDPAKQTDRVVKIAGISAGVLVLILLVLVAILLLKKRWVTAPPHPLNQIGWIFFSFFCGDYKWQTTNNENAHQHPCKCKTTQTQALTRIPSLVDCCSSICCGGTISHPSITNIDLPSETVGLLSEGSFKADGDLFSEVHLKTLSFQIPGLEISG